MPKKLERDYFMQRYHDVISSFGGKTSYDADNRPLLVMRSNLWASGYDVDGTDQTSLGQFSGRVQQTYKHSVPRFFVPEHGTMFTLALVRFPPTATKEIQYLNAKGALTYTDIAGDPVLYGNLPPREISMKDVFRSGDSSKKFKIAEGQWYRYAPSYVSPAYHLLEGFPFIQEPPSGDLQERVLTRHNSNFFSDKLVLTSVTPASSAPVLQTPKATSSTLYFDSLTVNNVYVGFMVWSNFTATKCRGLVSLNQVIKEIICLQPLK